MLFGGVVFPLLACILEVRLEEERRRLAEEVGPGFIRDQGVGASNCLPVTSDHCRLAPNQGSFELWCQGVNRIYPNLAFFKDSFCFKFQQSIDFDFFFGGWQFWPISTSDIIRIIRLHDTFFARRHQDLLLAFSEAAQEEARRIADEVLQRGVGTRKKIVGISCETWIKQRQPINSIKQSHAISWYYRRNSSWRNVALELWV